MSFSRNVGVRLLLAFFLLACAYAQDQSKPTDDAVPTFKASTHVVLLDVIATDKQGHPVTDLKRDEITIVEQGKQQKTASFALVDSKIPLKAADAIRDLSPGIYYNGTELEAQSGQITVLLLDALNTPFNDQLAGRKQMLKYVDGQRGKRMAIFGLTNALILLQDFTDDAGKLHNAVERRGTKQTPLHPQESGSSGAPALTQGGGLDAAGVNHYFEDYAVTQANSRTQITLEALKSIGRWLSGYPGRKKLIWISGSFPVQLDPGETARFTTKNPYTEEVKEAATMLTDAQVSVYTIDTGGMQGLGSSVFSASSSGTGSGRQLNRQVSGALGSYAEAHATMSKFAEQTGGLAYYNRNDIDAALASSVADGSIYYAVSYSPEDKRWDGNYRKLEIKSSRAGVQLRFRRGYYALDPLRAATQKPAQVDKEINSALVSPLLASSLSFYGSAEPVELDAGGNPQTHPAEVRFLVDMKHILFEPTADGEQHCSLKFFVGVYSGNKLVTHFEKTLDGNLKPEIFAKMAQTGMLFRTQVDVPAERVRLRLIVRDNRSGKIGALDIPYPNELAAK